VPLFNVACSLGAGDEVGGEKGNTAILALPALNPTWQVRVGKSDNEIFALPSRKLYRGQTSFVPSVKAKSRPDPANWMLGRDPVARDRGRDDGGQQLGRGGGLGGRLYRGWTASGNKPHGSYGRYRGILVIGVYVGQAGADPSRVGENRNRDPNKRCGV
jgi:hypothetical protein